MISSRYDKSIKWMLWITGILIFLLILSVIRRPPAQPWLRSDGPRIGVVEIKGLIIDSQRIVRQLDQFSRREDIAAILVRINSPGGTVAASQEIYEKLRKIREKGTKPIIASLGTLAASGGLYVALGADTIMANPGTATGSIGVILDYPVATDLLEKIGIRMEVIKSGPLKDAGSPYRTPDEADRRSFQRVIDDLFEQFTQVVARERQLSMDRVKELATGEIFTGREALALGLVDLLGGFEDALNLAGALTGNLDRPVIIRPVEPQRWSLRRYLLGNEFGQSWYPQLMPQYRMR